MRCCVCADSAYFASDVLISHMWFLFTQVARRDTFVAMGDKGAMFRSSERQQIIDYIIRSKIKDGKCCCS